MGKAALLALLDLRPWISGLLLCVSTGALADFTLEKDRPASPGTMRDVEACRKSADVKACMIGKMSDRLALSRAAFDQVFANLDPAFRKYLAQKCRDPRPYDQWEKTTAPEKVIPCYAGELATISSQLGSLSCSSPKTMYDGAYSSVDLGGCITVVRRCGEDAKLDFAVCPCKDKPDDVACIKQAMKNYYAQATMARSAVQRARAQSEAYSQDFGECTKKNAGNSCVPGGEGGDQGKLIQPAMYGPFLAVNGDGTGAADSIAFKQPSVDTARSEETAENKRDDLRKKGDPGADSDSDPGASGSGIGRDGDGSQTPFGCDGAGNPVESCDTGGKPMDGSKSLTVLGIGDGAQLSISSAAKTKILQKYMMTIAETYYSILAKQGGIADDNFNKKADALPDACSVPTDPTFGLGNLSSYRESLLQPIAKRAKDQRAQDAKALADAQKAATGGLTPMSENEKYAVFAAKAAKELWRLDNEIGVMGAGFAKPENGKSITDSLPSWLPCQTFFKVAVDPFLAGVQAWSDTKFKVCGHGTYFMTDENYSCAPPTAANKESTQAERRATWCGTHQASYPNMIADLGDAGRYAEIHRNNCHLADQEADDLLERMGWANADTCNIKRCNMKGKYMRYAMEQKAALLAQYPELASKGASGKPLYVEIASDPSKLGAPTIKGIPSLDTGMPDTTAIDKVTAAMAPAKSNDRLDQLKGLMASICKDPDTFFNNLMASPEALRGLMNCSESPDLVHTPAGLETAIQSAALCKQLRFSKGEICQIQKTILDAKENGVMNAYNAIQPVVATAMDVAGCFAAGRTALNGMARIAASLSAGGEVGQVAISVMSSSARNMVVSVASPGGLAMMAVPAAFDFQNLKSSKDSAAAVSSACLAGIVKDGATCKAAATTLATADKEFVHGLFVGFLAAGILHEEGESGTKFSQLKDAWEKGGKDPAAIRPQFEKYVSERTGLPPEAVHSFAEGMSKSDYAGFFDGKVDAKTVAADLARMKDLTKGKSADALKTDPKFIEVRVRLASIEDFVAKGGKLSPADSAFVASMRKIIYDSASADAKKGLKGEILRIEEKKARLEELQRRKSAGDKLSVDEAKELQVGISLSDRALYDGYGKLVFDDALGGKDPAKMTANERIAALGGKTEGGASARPGALTLSLADHEAAALKSVGPTSPVRDLVKGIAHEGREGAAARKNFIDGLIKIADSLPEPERAAAKARIAEVIKLIEDPELRKRLGSKLEDFAREAEEALTSCAVGR
jgi:hypothetical protein